MLGCLSDTPCSGLVHVFSRGWVFLALWLWRFFFGMKTRYLKRAVCQPRILTLRLESLFQCNADLAELGEIVIFDGAEAVQLVAPADWIFASPFNGGKSPYFPTAVRRKIHAAAVRAGLSHLLKGEPTKIFRHSYRSWLGASNTPLAIIKDLMMHADIRTTMNEYGNAMPQPMRSANSRVVQTALRSRQAV
jgi:integrase